MAPIITLTTDFGLQDSYVASMKGVILGICPEARLVDVSHLIPPQDVRAGAFVLKTTVSYFPPGTVHVAVVDPGVGGDRKGIAIRTKRSFLVGPDNGLFSLLLDEEPALEVRSLENPRARRPVVSSTFHGRDVFAPAAAHLASGMEFEELGPPHTPLTPQWSTVSQEGNALRGEVLHIDHFGNIITNLTDRRLASFAWKAFLAVTIGELTLSPLVQTYGDAEPNAPLALIGSSGFLEIAVNGGHAASLLGVRVGDSLLVLRKSEK